MFAAVARFDARFRWAIVAVWVIGTVAVVRSLPSLSSVLQTNNVQFLPSSSPSVQANQLAAPFQGQNPAGTAIIVATRSSGTLSADDQTDIGRVEALSREVAGVSSVTDKGISPDGTTEQALVTVPTSISNGNPSSASVVDAIRATFAQVQVRSGLTFHLAGPLAVSVDAANNTNGGAITKLTLLFVFVLLFLAYRAVLAPLITIIPAALAVLISGPLIAELSNAGLSVASVVQQLLIVLVLGAGTDYGLFLVFRMREEIRRGASPSDALGLAVGKVGQAITFSGLTVIAALTTLLLAPFGIYRGLGPSLAIGIAVMLAAGLTLTPALLAIFGSAAFWPTHPQPGPEKEGLWGRVAERVVRHPVATLCLGVILFGALTTGLIGYRTGGLTNSTVQTGTDSAAGTAVLSAHFPKANAGADQLLLVYGSSVWGDPTVLSDAQSQLAGNHAFQSITGPLGAGNGSVTAVDLAALHARLGPAQSLPALQVTQLVPPSVYRAYRSTAQFISADGRTVQMYAVLRTGAVGTAEAASGIPDARHVLAAVAASTGAQSSGISGQDASAYDISDGSNTSLKVVIPIALVLILILLGMMLRSLVAPWYLALTVGLSYLASLGFAMIVFVHLGGSDGLIFVLPLLMFVFSMALGEDYNILVMSRIREEAHHTASLSAAVTRAIGVTGSTITSAGVILAGTFAVLGLAGGSTQAQQLGFSISFGVVLDTFFVRTLLVPSIAMLLGRWNWWPSRLASPGASDLR